MWTFTVFVLMKLLVLANSQVEDEYTVNFNSPIYLCPDEESQAFMNTDEVEVKRYNESVAVMTGAISFLKGLEEDTMARIILEKDMGESYEFFTVVEICDVCAELGNPESLYSNYLKNFGFPEKCPFDAGKYDIIDFVADTKEEPLNIAFEGLYQVTMNMYKRTDDKCLDDKTFLGCLKLDIIVEPL